MFKSVFAVQDCKIWDLKEKGDWANGKQIGVKTVCSVVQFAEKPIECDVPVSLIQDISNKIDVPGSVKIEEVSVMEVKPYKSDDGTPRYSWVKVSKNFKLLQFIPHDKK